MKLHDTSHAAKPDEIDFNSKYFTLKYKDLALEQINYDLQTQLVIPLINTIEADYQNVLHLNKQVYSTDQDTTPKLNSSPQKLQWKGPINKLVTIFYDLANTAFSAL